MVQARAAVDARGIARTRRESADGRLAAHFWCRAVVRTAAAHRHGSSPAGGLTAIPDREGPALAATALAVRAVFRPVTLDAGDSAVAASTLAGHVSRVRIGAARASNVAHRPAAVGAQARRGAARSTSTAHAASTASSSAPSSGAASCNATRTCTAESTARARVLTNADSAAIRCASGSVAARRSVVREPASARAAVRCALRPRPDALAIDADEAARATARRVARQTADDLVFRRRGACASDGEREGPERCVRRKTKTQA